MTWVERIHFTNCIRGIRLLSMLIQQGSGIFLVHLDPAVLVHLDPTFLIGSGRLFWHWVTKFLNSNFPCRQYLGRSPKIKSSGNRRPEMSELLLDQLGWLIIRRAQVLSFSVFFLEIYFFLKKIILKIYIV